MAPSRPHRRLLALLALLVGVGCLAPTAGRTLAATNGIRSSDVPKRHWPRTTVDLVGASNDWMRDYPAKADGTDPFHPNDLESRILLARSVVRAFAPEEPADPAVTFPDLPAEDPLAPFANVAVKLGWMATDASGNFLPYDPVTPRMVHRALVLAVELGDLAAGLDAIHTRDGTPFQVPRTSARSSSACGSGCATTIQRTPWTWLQIPHSPGQRWPSLSHAGTMPTWMHDSLAGYASIVLPNLGPAMRRVVQFGIGSVGSPYVWGGEWIAVAPPGYAGWSLPQRSSADMASTGQTIKRFRDVRPGDLIFYDESGDGVVDHVDVSIGGGWALDSSGSAGGVTITNVTSSWYRDNFVHARRIIGAAVPAA